MTDEVQEEVVTPAEDSVSEPADTASAENPEDGENKPEPAERTFTQAELNEIVAKREAKVTRKYTRELKDRMEQLEQRMTAQSQPKQEDQVLDRSRYASEDAYIDAMAEHKATEKLRQIEERQALTASQAKKEKVLLKAEESGEFDREEFFDKVKVLSPMVADAIIDSPIADKLLIHLNANPQEADRIANLPLARQAAEIGKLEATLATKKAEKSGAPAPIKPINSGGNVAGGYDPNMSDAEFKKWYAKESQRKKSY